MRLLNRLCAESADPTRDVYTRRTLIRYAMLRVLAAYLAERRVINGPPVGKSRNSAVELCSV